MSARGPWRDLPAGIGAASLLPAWLGVLALTFGWLRELWIYAPATGGATWFAVGIGLLVVGCRGGEPGPRQISFWPALLLGVASFIGALYLPRPFDLGPWLLVGAACLALIPLPQALRHRLLPGIWTAGLVLVLQSALWPALFTLASRQHDAPFLAPFVYYPLKLLAPATVRAGATMHMLTAADSIPLTVSWEKLALIPGALITTGFVSLVLLHRNGLQRLPGFVLLGLLFAWARLLVLFLIVSRYRQPQVFWNLDALFVSFVPWTLAVAAWWRLGRNADIAPPAGERHETYRRVVGWRRRAALGACLCAAGLTFACGYQDPGRRKLGRILIDESHSDWEWTTQAFDTEWYGGKSGYNYYCLADYWNHFYDVETRREPLTPVLLAKFDVLVIKTPTAAYAPAEQDAIADFVQRGGGLFLIGDHTNVFGSSTYLNPIAGRFGLYFRYDATYRIDNLDLTLWRPPAVLPHAVVRNMGEFLFATSCSMDAPLLAENVVIGYGLRGIYLDYSEVSYFPTKKDKMDDMYPLLVQSAGVRFGKGRVLGFTDSTVFSNFFMFIPGKPELALGAIEWLNRTNRHGWLLRLGFLLGLAGLGLVLWELARAPRLAVFGTVIPLGLLAFVLVAALCERDAMRAYALPQPRHGLEDVVFDGEHGTFGLPMKALISEHWSNMQTFYVWMQRLGLVPRRVEHLAEALQHPARALIEVNPARPFSLQEIDGIVDYVRRGGILLVLDTPLSANSQSNQLLGPFSIAFAAQRQDSLAVLRPKSPAGDWLTGPVPGDTLGIAVQAFGVVGGTPLLTLPDGTAVLAARDFDRGKVIAFGASQLFSTSNMGGTAAVPNPRLRALYQAQYDLMTRVAGLRATTRYAPPLGAQAN